MGSSPSSNQKKSRVTIDSSAADVGQASNGQITLSVPHVSRSNAAFSYDSTQFGSHVHMVDDMSFSGVVLNESQQRMVRICLGQLETDLGIALNCDKLINYVQVVVLDPGQTLLSPDHSQEEGLFIVEDGALEVCTIRKQEPIARLLQGDFCGELTVLFGGRFTAVVQNVISGQTRCLYISTQDIHNHWLDGSLNKRNMLSWCVKRCYVDFTGMFPSGQLSKQILHTAVQSNALFNDWSDEAISVLTSNMSLVLFSDGDEVITRDRVIHQLFFLLRGSITMVTGDGTQHFKCIKSCEEGYTLLTKEFFGGQPSQVSISCNAPTMMSCLSKDDIITMFPELSALLTNKITLL
ncbi:uncharacterized protein [Dysidea avara]|uniref:uncharacterized protein isoform X2 n=1 Tax=Dysidea avara TaxID=196820 RepID=UPI0033249DAC